MDYSKTVKNQISISKEPEMLIKTKAFFLSNLIVAIMLGCVLFSVTEVFAQREMPAPTVRVEKVSTLTETAPKPYQGYVKPKEIVNLVARVSGYLDKVVFEEGGLIKKDDLLFKIEDTVYAINVRVTEATIKQIEAELTLANRTLARNHQAKERMASAISDHELDESVKAVELLEARLEEAKARLDNAKNDFSYTEIKSPITGRIGVKKYSEGNYITPSSGYLATVVQYDPIRISFSLNDADYVRYIQKHGGLDNTNIKIIRADGEPYTGKFELEFIDNKLDDYTGTITIYLICENADEQLVPNGFVRVLLSEQFAEPMPAVDISALMTDGTHHFVYVLGKDNVAERREVVTGPQVIGKQVIESGLKVGEQVIVGGVNKVIPGKPVVPVMQNIPDTTQGQPEGVKESAKKLSLPGDAKSSKEAAQAAPQAEADKG